MLEYVYVTSIIPAEIRDELRAMIAALSDIEGADGLWSVPIYADGPVRPPLFPGDDPRPIITHYMSAGHIDVRLAALLPFGVVLSATDPAIEEV